MGEVQGDAGSGNTSVKVSAVASELEPGSTYCYVLVADRSEFIINEEGEPEETEEEEVVTSQREEEFKTLGKPPPPPEESGAPEVRDGALTELSPTRVRVHGLIDPEGACTTFAVEYGRTDNYGSRTKEQMVPGPCSAKSGLEVATVLEGLKPGTVYWVRLEATNEHGTAYGELHRAFITPGPVEATTGTATGRLETQATLNGTVNPRGYQTYYHFQYGTSTQYGSNAPGGNAGFGSSAVPVSTVATGLEPGVTIHYRLVATSGGVTSYGADETVASIAPPAASVIAGKRFDVFYRGDSGTLNVWEWDALKWSFQSLGESEVVDGSPAPIQLSRTRTDVFYRGANGKLSFWELNEGKWTLQSLGGESAVASDPAPVEVSGQLDVFYRGTDGGLHFWDWNGSSWTLQSFGDEGALATSPTTFLKPVEGLDVFYQGIYNTLYSWGWNGSEWTNQLIM